MASHEGTKDSGKDAQAKPCHICGEHHAGVCKFCLRCRIFHNASVGCKAKKVTKSVGTFVQQMLPKKRSASELENSEQLEPQGKRVNLSSGTVQAAAEQQEGEVEGPSLEESEMGEVQAEDMDEEERIDLRAVECCDRGVQLSTPPFPFRQYWDEQYDTQEKRRDRRESRPRMRASPDYTVGGCA